VAQRSRYPGSDNLDLLRVAQWIVWERGEDELYYVLREVFDVERQPTSLHQMLARVARSLAEAGLPALLIATTNDDDLMEQALREQGLEHDIVWYEAKRDSKEVGRFIHLPPDGRPTVIRQPNKYTA